MKAYTNSKTPISDKKYRIIYADPPWKFSSWDKSGSGRGLAEDHYPTMSVNDICALPVQDIADDSCLLAMWWVSPMPKEAIQVCEAWGFRLSKMDGFSWLKLTETGKDCFGMGKSTRPSLEHCLFGYRGKVGDVVKANDVRQLIRAARMKHSQKPEEARNRLIRLCGDVPRIELFARQSTPGWDVWGNEVDGSRSVVRRDDLIKRFGG